MFNVFKMLKNFLFSFLKCREKRRGKEKEEKVKINDGKEWNSEEKKERGRKKDAESGNREKVRTKREINTRSVWKHFAAFFPLLPPPFSPLFRLRRNPVLFFFLLSSLFPDSSFSFLKDFPSPSVVQVCSV